MLRLDLSGLKCPVPLMRTKKKLAEMMAGEKITVIATDPHSRDDFLRFCDGRQCSVLEFEKNETGLVFVIRKEGMHT